MELSKTKRKNQMHPKQQRDFWFAFVGAVVLTGIMYALFSSLIAWWAYLIIWFIGCGSIMGSLQKQRAFGNLAYGEKK